MATALQPDNAARSNVINFPSPVKTPPIGNLAERAMMVTLNLSAWKAQRVDKKLTDEVLKERNAERDAGRFEKHLIPPSALKPITEAHTAARARHYTFTLPWGENGQRILAASAFFEYSTAMSEERSKCEVLYREFLAEYPRLLAEAPARLGPQLFNAKDFPAPHRIAEKFGFKLDVMPVPTKDDFRVELGEDAEQAIRSSIEETVKERYGDAQRDLWERLLDTVKHFAETMKQDKKKFHNTTLTKLVDLARIAPKLSLTRDAKLEEMCADIIKLTSDVDSTTLRENKAIRRHAAEKAMDAVKKIEANLQGAF